MTTSAHEAMQIRLQVAHNALQGLVGLLEGWHLNVGAGEAYDEDARQMFKQYKLVLSALAIVRGESSEIPEELKMSTIGLAEEAALRMAAESDG